MNSKKVALVVSLACALIALGVGLSHASSPKPQPQWITIGFPTDGSSPGYTGFLQGSPTFGRYDPTANQLIVFGGYGYGGPNGPNGISGTNALWVLNDANDIGGSPQWSQVIAEGAFGSPPPRYNHTVVYDSEGGNSRLIVFGGCGGGCLPVYNDVWVLTNANGVGGFPTWSQLNPSGGPPPGRQGAVGIYDPSSNTMTIFGGQDGAGSGGIYTDTWVLSNANGLGGTPEWTQLSPLGVPPQMPFESSAVYDEADHIMTVFGGTDTSLYTNLVFTLSHANNQGGTPAWTQLSPTGTPPLPRVGASVGYHPLSNRMVMFGGVENGGFFGMNTWVLSHANGTGGTAAWIRLTPTDQTPLSGPAPTQSPAYGYDPSNNRLIIWGGNTAEGFIQGTWVLTHANGR
jgi:hypothetical protein